MRIGILGGTHGSLLHLDVALHECKMAYAEHLVQLGDFGIQSGYVGRRYIEQVSMLCQQYSIDLSIVPGDYDDWITLDALPIDDQGWMRASDSVRIAPRGQRWIWGDTSFAAVGGAVSMDEYLGMDGYTRSPRSEVSREEIIDVSAAGGTDVLLLHDAPDGFHNDLLNHPGWHAFTSQDILERSREHRKMIREIMENIRPSFVAHSHYHEFLSETQEMEYGEVSVLGLGSDGSPGSFAILDCENGRVDRSALQMRVVY